MIDPFAGVNSNELMGTFNRVPKAFNTKKLNNAYEGLFGNLQSTGQQLANNAGQEYLGRAQQSGASTLGAGVAQAQAYLPFLNQVANLKTQQAKDTMQAKEGAISLQAQIAQQLAGLRQNYANSLANFQSTSRGQDMQQQQIGLAEDAQNYNQFASERAWNQQFGQGRGFANDGFGGYAGTSFRPLNEIIFAF